MLNLKSNRMIGVAFLIVLATKIFKQITHINAHIFPWSISENDLEFFYNRKTAHSVNYSYSEKPPK